MILLVGANGYLGQKLSETFKRKKKKFIKIDQTLKGRQKIDINDKFQLEKIFFNNKFKVIINCSCEPATSKLKNKIFKTNVGGNKNLIQLAERYKVKKFIFFSTSAVWVKDYRHPVNEKTKTFSVETYGKSKINAENDIIKSKLANWTIFRIPMIVSERRLGVLSLLFDFIINNKKIPLINNGNNLIQFIHIDDLVKFVLKSLNINEKEIYNLASEEILSLKELYLKLINSINSKSKLIFFKDFGLLYMLSILNKINISPLNIYHLKMLKYSLVMDTKKITKKYNLKAKIKTSDMMISALKAYKNKKKFSKYETEITSPIRMGILKIFYYFF